MPGVCHLFTNYIEGFSMPAQFDRFGISFAFPDNWSLDDSEDDLPFPSVTVSSPETAFWSVSLHSRDTNVQELIETTIQAIRGEYGNLDVQEICDDFEGQSIHGCELNFCYLDLFSTAQIRVFRRNHHVCLLICQAEDHEFETMRLVFDAITTSLLRG
ncbi:MAG: hypothetical protein JW829_19980 [Pirellulales bacterium]|nr:hypothetical protein [Pirellulales bacterium]